MIVDQSEWYDAWREEIDYTEGTECNYDTVLAIDCSGSMSSNDAFFYHTYRDTLYPGSSYTVKTCYRKLAAENYIHTQRGDDQTAIVLFDSCAKVVCPLTDSRLTAIGSLDGIYSYGGTSFINAINASVIALEESDESHKKMIVLISDGEASVNSSTIQLAVTNGIVINTVYIGYSSSSAVLQDIAEKTGGEYFKATTAEELVNVCNEIAIRQKIDLTDRDNDGLPDVYEIRGMKPSNGDAPFYTDPGNPDSDGDGLLDGEEVVATPFLHIIKAFDDAGVSCDYDAYVFSMNSNPNNPDTDRDGINDGEDNRPWTKGVYSEKIGSIVTGELIIVSSMNNPAGHAFLVYHSFINDRLDLTKLAGGFEYMTWNELEPCEYEIAINEYMTIGSTSALMGSIGEPFESPWHLNDGDKAGIYFNREFAEERDNYDKNYNANEPDKFKQKYGNNVAYSRHITRKQMEKAIDYCGEHEYYNLVANNCSKIAVCAWNEAFDKKEFYSVMSPLNLYWEIAVKKGVYMFDMYRILQIEL